MDVKMNNDTIDVIVNFIRNQEGWSLGELKSELLSETQLLRSNGGQGFNVDEEECSVIWGTLTAGIDEVEELCCADNLISSYTTKLLDAFCNMLESFKDQECFLYNGGE